MKNFNYLLFTFLVFVSLSCKHTSDVQPAATATKLFPVIDITNFSGALLTPIVILGKTDQAGFINATGAAARFNGPYAIAVQNDGSLLIGDSKNNAIRKISINANVTTAIQSSDFSQEITAVAAANDGTVAVNFDADIYFYKDGALKFDYGENCFHCEPTIGIDKDPNGTSFWYTNSINSGLGGITPSGTLWGATEFNSNPTSQNFLFNFYPTALSASANGYKYISTEHSVYSYKAGVVKHILGNTTFDGITAICANKTGTKIYLADGGDIKLISECVTSNCPTILTILAKNVAASAIRLSNSEKVLFFTSALHNTVSKINLL